MATPTLADALSGLRITGAENPYGMSLIALNQAAPNLYNPYGKPGANFGIAIGQALLSGLLGYQARRQATEESLQATDLASQLIAKPAAERSAFLKGLAEQDTPTNVMSRLTEVSPAILLQENLIKSQIDQEVAKKQALAEFELGPVGSKLYERDLQKAREMATIRTAGGGGAAAPKQEKDFFEKIPAGQKPAFTGTLGQVKQLRDLAGKFKEIGSNAIELNLEKQIPGSKADLAISAMKTLVPSTVKMLGDTGALSAYDQQAVEKATLGGPTSGALSIAARLNQLADLAESRTITALETYKTASESGGDVLLQQLKAGMSGTSSGTSPEIAAKILAIDRMLQNPGVSDATKAALMAKKEELSR